MTDYTTIQYVELFHLLFLDQLGRKLDKRFYALKGGCNLRFYFKSIRYSEAIDLDIQIFPKEKLQDRIVAILTSKPFKQLLQLRGINIYRWSDPKQTEITQRWKLTLAISRTDLILPTKIEFSRRGMTAGTAFEAIDPEIIRNYKLSPILLNHYDAHTAYEQKVEALISRSTTQARDIFDLNLLLNTGVEKSITNKKIINRLREAQSNALSVTFKTFKSQVLSFLYPEYQEQYDSEPVWDDMVLKVVEAIGETVK